MKIEKKPGKTVCFYTIYFLIFSRDFNCQDRNIIKFPEISTDNNVAFVIYSSPC